MYRIKQLRKESGLSQRALASKIGASAKAVNFWEQEKADPTARFVISLADAFEVSTDYLLGRENDLGNITINGALNEKERYVLMQYSKLSSKQQETALDFIGYLLSK